MFKQRVEAFNYILRIHDVGIIICSFLLAYLLRSYISSSSDIISSIDPALDYLWIVIIAVPLWIIGLKYHRAYEFSQRKYYTEIIWIITRAMFINTTGLFSILFITKSSHISRLLVLLFGLITYVLLIVGRTGLWMILREIHRRGYHCRNILIAGTGQRARTYGERFASHSDWGLRVIGYVDDQPTKADQEILGTKILGKLRDIPTILEENVIDEIVAALPRSSLPQLEPVVQICEAMGTKVTIAADFFNVTTAKVSFALFHDMPLLTYSTTPPQQFQILLKNFIDFFGAIILLILAFPILILTYVFIKLTSPGPVFYNQTRCGVNGRTFTMYKFRSMEVDAEKKIERLRQYNEVTGPAFKMKNDPRVTPIGRFLRRTSIDELPQLINVLKGEMSLVGPRPPIPGETRYYDRWQRRRLSVKPGLTCLWQISGRNGLGFEKWMEADLYYIDNWSLRLDLQILLKTIPAVLRGEGW